MTSLPNIAWHESTGSTNSDARDPSLGHGSMVATTHQVSGRGRLSREWVCPPGKSLAMSLVLEVGRVPNPHDLTWVPLLAGLTLADVINSYAADVATVKWPNDVLVADRKVAGVLSELTADGRIIVGVGVNWALDSHELPVPTATSLNLHGIIVDPMALAEAWREAMMASVMAGVTPEVRGRLVAASATIGRSVRIEFPSGETDRGMAVALGEDGSLLVECTDGVRRVSAGDVTHLRHND